MWVTANPIMFVNYPSFVWDPPKKSNQNYFTVGAVVPTKDEKSMNTYVLVVLFDYDETWGEAKLRVIRGMRYVGYDLPVNREALISYASPLGQAVNVNKTFVPLAMAAGEVGLGLTNLTMSLQESWPTASPSASPPPAPPLPSGNYIMATNLLSYYVDSDCSTLNPNALVKVSATTYGLCIPNPDCKDNVGCFLRTAVGSPLQTNPKDPISVPTYPAFYNDTDCTIKVNDGPPVLLKSNYCYASREVGVFEKFTYVEQKS
eukprot:GSChrysophyteH1.ASY1.ANO1.2674.1 assembled CDS